jgi:isoleucyl-tRNA synthetase
MKAGYHEFTQLNLPETEKETLARWQKTQAFEKSVSLRENAPAFVFYEGPPSANGMPGIHHVISRTLKDLVCRYKTMQGFQVKRKGGWDTHGLPVELGVEKELGITKEDIGKKISIEEYNNHCREAVLRYKDKWDELTNIMGYWVDLNDPYITFQNNYIESLWWLLSKLYKKGLLYESVSIQPYSPAAGTGLSSHELNMPGTYKDVKDTSCVAMFKAVQNEQSQFLYDASKGEEVFFMAWTTTPWTLPSNLGLTVGPEIEYLLVKTFNPYTHLPIHVVLAAALVNKYFKPEAENGDFAAYSPETKILPWQIVTRFTGKQAEGCRYEQLLPYTANSVEVVRESTPDADPFKVVTGDFVTTEDGTGIVHTAPAFGADDYKMGQKNNLGILVMVDREGKFLDGLGEFSLRYVKDYKNDPAYIDVNIDICVKLKKENRAFKVEKYEHSYPHCWRTDKPILYYPLDAWFIKTTALKERMVELNKTINWKPPATGEGRFGNWLENMVDWNLSRSRYWGTPLPVWRTEDGEEKICIGSVAELKIEIEKAITILGSSVNNQYLKNGELDLHKPYIDNVTLVSASGKPMKRIPDLIDVWFDSGAMPFAQWHFPFENKEIFANSYPADFIAEGVDQTRGWFYTLHAISALVKEEIQEELKTAGIEANDEKYPGVAFKTVVSNGLVLDKNGNKMSKSKGNVVDPFATIQTYGADATRWYLVTNTPPWDNLKFDLAGIQESQRKFFGTLFHTYQFFALYANIDGFDFSAPAIPMQQRPEIDRWVISLLHTLIAKVTRAMDDYEPTVAGRLIEDFTDEHLSNWYVRLCRKRFWKPISAAQPGDEHDKQCAYQTLYECLETLAKLIAPISPFFSDTLFCNLNNVTKKHSVESVHHTNFPKPNELVIDSALEERMQLAQDITSLILSVRKKVNIKVRQPLQKALIPVLTPGMQQQLELVEDLIKNEVNIKELDYLSPDNQFIRKKAKANFKTLGKRLGKHMKDAATLIQDDPAILQQIETTGTAQLHLPGGTIAEITAEDVEIIAEDIPGWALSNKGSLTAALDITLTEPLINEGNAREIINRVQNIRKDKQFDITDRIIVQVSDNENLRNSLTDYNTYICAEIQADLIEFLPGLTTGVETEINDYQLLVNVIKKEV